MGTVVCVNCNTTIEHYEFEKVTTLYSNCPDCKNKKKHGKKTA
ncbi:GapA-binding peptide SR1P [Alkalihalobacillus sp. TS-13]|nr:GapA-binding peptide SR1P [Alkalihalobacillus sp. TS-13]